MSDAEQFVLEIQPTPTAREASTLPAEVLSVLRLFDGKRSLGDVVEESPLDVSSTLAVVQRAAELGLVGVGRKQPPCRFKNVGPSVKQWLGCTVSATEAHGFDNMIEGELEAGLDRALSDLEKQQHCPRAPAPLENLPQALERSLKRALDRYLDPDVAKAPPHDCTVYGELERCLDEALERPVDALVIGGRPEQPARSENGFTAAEQDFFDSYAPEPIDQETIADLLRDPDPAV
jgi:hypothetical protein